LKKVKRIFIGTNEIAGAGGNLQQAFQKLGVKADFVVFLPPAFGMSKPLYIDLNGKSPSARYWLSRYLLWKYLLRCDSFLFLFGSSFWPNNSDLPVLKKFGKRIGQVFLGCDIRCKEIMQQENPEFCLCNKCAILEVCDSASKYRLAARWEKSADLLFSLPIHSQILKRPYHNFYMPVNLDNFTFSPGANPVPLVVHAPSDRALKGTGYIVQAVEELKAEGLSFEFVLLENLPHEQVQQYIEKCDLVIDQVLIGWYGVFAVEALARGKPVVCHIREDLKTPDNPILSVQPGNVEEIKQALRKLITDSQLRKSLAVKGRAYVENRHDSLKIAKGILELFEVTGQGGKDV